MFNKYRNLYNINIKNKPCHLRAKATNLNIKTMFYKFCRLMIKNAVIIIVVSRGQEKYFQDLLQFIFGKTKKLMKPSFC